VGGEPADGPLIPTQVPQEEPVQAWHEITADEVLQLLRTAEGLENATYDPRSHPARDTVLQDVELSTGERFRIMVQRLR
jgi:hypothetical protein